MSVYWEIAQKAGPVFWVITALGICALTIVAERWFHLHRAQINVGELLNGLLNVLKRDSRTEAVSLCEHTPGPVAHVLRAMILRYDQGVMDLKQAAEDAALDEVPRLERHINILATIGYVAPLLGLLGTVLGMIDVFQVIQAKGAFVNAINLSEGIWKALLTTAAGLTLAIPCYVAYNYLVSRVRAIVLDIDKASSELIYFFQSAGPAAGRDKEASAGARAEFLEAVREAVRELKVEKGS